MTSKGAQRNCRRCCSSSSDLARRGQQESGQLQFRIRDNMTVEPTKPDLAEHHLDQAEQALREAMWCVPVGTAAYGQMNDMLTDLHFARQEVRDLR